MSNEAAPTVQDESPAATGLRRSLKNILSIKDLAVQQSTLGSLQVETLIEIVAAIDRLTKAVSRGATAGEATAQHLDYLTDNLHEIGREP